MQTTFSELNCDVMIHGGMLSCLLWAYKPRKQYALPHLSHDTRLVCIASFKFACPCHLCVTIATETTPGLSRPICNNNLDVHSCQQNIAKTGDGY